MRAAGTPRAAERKSQRDFQWRAKVSLGRDKMPVIVGHKTQVSAVLSLIELAKAVQLHRHTVTDQD